MTTLSTHDTKRSEDVRARLAVLAEMPREWTDRVRRWSARHPLPRTLAGAAGVAEPRRRVADPGRPDGGLPHEGRRRRPSSPPATSRPCRRSTRRSRPGPRRCSPTPSWSPRSRQFVARISGARLVELAGPEAAAARGPGRARRLPGHRSLRVLAGRPGQPQAGRLGGAARPARPTRRGLAARRRRGGGGEAPGHHERAAAAPRTGPRCSPATARCPPMGPPPRTPWRSSGRRRWSRWRRGCRSGWPPAAAGATRCSRCPTAPRLARRRHRHRRRRGRTPARATSWRATRWRCSSVRREGGSARG